MSLHARNKHKGTYDFPELIRISPTLKNFIKPNKFGKDSIDFSNQEAVKTLNQALIKSYYQISYWDIPKEYLIPPIPGRGDYIHHLADLLGEPMGSETKVLDIGTGSSLIYPIIGNRDYGWSFIGSEIDPTSLENAQTIIDQNTKLKNIELRFQKNSRDIFLGVLKSNEFVDACICNPPFHANQEEAQKGTLRKYATSSKEKI